MEEEIDLRDYLNMIKKRWKIILGVFLSSIIISVVVSFSLPKVYEVRVMIRIGKARDELLETGKTVMKVFETKSVLSDVVKRLNLPVTEKEIERIKGKIYISEVGDVLEVKGRGNTPEKALELVRFVAKVILERHELLFNERKFFLKEYISGVENQLVEIEKNIKNLKKKIKRNEQTDSQAKAYIVQGYIQNLESSSERYNRLKVEMHEKRLEESYEATPSCIIALPMKSSVPILPRKKINILIAAFVGLIIGLGLAGLVEYFEQPVNKN
ncbi:hypothetical protein KAU39_04375 [bacterium]|nr:hypothetical protein [bacterium]